ncbi:hypothetical protein OAV46_03230 [Euryarchaeota archaeon]|nr:hypothetical protein [Euryarchaeota archaeon]
MPISDMIQQNDESNSIDEEINLKYNINSNTDSKSNVSNNNAFGFQINSIFSDTTISTNLDSSETFIILDDGKIICLGHSPCNSDAIPMAIPGISAKMLSSAGSHRCVLFDDSSLRCWGNLDGSNYFTNNNLSSSTEIIFDSNKSAVYISSGHSHDCAIVEDGELFCWGDIVWSTYGPNSSNIPINSPRKMDFSNNLSAVAVDTSYRSTCAILNDTSTKCWGVNENGQLGDGTQASSGGSENNYVGRMVNVSFSGESYAVALASSMRHRCAIMNNGSIQCWGQNNAGQVGIGSTGYAVTTPQLVNIGENVSAVGISAGRFHTCVLLNDSSVKCWGYNGDGQLGDNSTNNSLIPVDVLLDPSIIPVSINSGSRGNCIVTALGSLYCWGESPSYVNQCWECRMIPTEVVLNSSGTMGWDGNLDLGEDIRTVLLQTRDFDNDGVLNIFDSIIPNDSDGDGFINSLDDYPSNPTRSISCDSGTFGRYYCEEATAGHFVQLNGSLGQDFCNYGQFQNQTAQTSCTNASPGYKVNSYASINQTMCDRGTFQPISGQRDCNNASRGNYVNTRGSVTQIECSIGTYQPNLGQTNCINATFGNYVDINGAVNQLMCPSGTYNPQNSSTNISDCLITVAGHYSIEGSANQIQCLPGTFQPNNGQGNCLSAQLGYFVPNYSAVSETPCPLGTYQNNTSQSNCIDTLPGTFVNVVGSINPVNAQAGYFVPNHAAVSETPCPLGTYQNNTSQINCIDSPPGTFVNTVGSINPILCSLGFFQNKSSQTSCYSASIGYFVDKNGSSSQNKCPLYYSTLNQSSKSILDCLLDSDADNIPNLVDYDDDNDGTIDSEDAWPLDTCVSLDHDSDNQPDSIVFNCFTELIEDDDDDNDRVSDYNDFCPLGEINWISGSALGTDHDGDGCRDNGEDIDDDGDGVDDVDDECPRGHIGWLSNPMNDIDGDGCHEIEDYDNDGDGINNVDDIFPGDPSEWNDTDQDGVGDNSDSFPNDASETVDTDGDGVGDNGDAYPNDSSRWSDNAEEKNKFIIPLLFGIISTLIIALIFIIRRK